MHRNNIFTQMHVLYQTTCIVILPEVHQAHEVCEGATISSN